MSSSPAGPSAHSSWPTAPYDLIKELTIALAVILAGVLVVAALLSSPDTPPLTIQTWAQKAPLDFVATAVSELRGTSESSQYGPPYNHGTAELQSLGFLAPQSWAGVHLPVDPAQQFVITPLGFAATGDSHLAAALKLYKGTPPDARAAWLAAYAKALPQSVTTSSGIALPAGDYGPVPLMMNSLLSVARSGGLDGLLLVSHNFYQTDYTQTLLFMGDGAYLYKLASDHKLLSNQWGMMNETGNYPGQTWLWLFTMWYQIPPYSSSHSADLMIILTMAVLTLALAMVPFVPGLRDIPRWLPVHRLIWHTKAPSRRG